MLVELSYMLGDQQACIAGAASAAARLVCNVVKFGWPHNIGHNMMIFPSFEYAALLSSQVSKPYNVNIVLMHSA